MSNNRKKPMDKSTNHNNQYRSNENLVDASSTHRGDEESVGGHVEVEGIVVESTRGVIKVRLESGQIVTTKLCGKMRENKIHIILEDRVKVKLSPYDLNRGFIVRRIKV